MFVAVKIPARKVKYLFLAGAGLARKMLKMFLAGLSRHPKMYKFLPKCAKMSKFPARARQKENFFPHWDSFGGD